MTEAGASGGGLPAPGSSPPASLMQTGARGFLWTGGSQMVSQSLHFGIRVILAMLLLPADFGLMTMATVFLGLGTLVLDLGLGNALVQRAEIDEEHRSTLFWFTLLLALGLCLLVMAVAPAVGLFFHEPRVVPILRVLALGLLLSAPEGTFAALLLRELDFKSLGIRQMAGTAVAGIVGIAAALAGLGVWALVTYAVAQSGVRAVLLWWRSEWRPRLRWSRTALAELWRFGRWVAGGRLVNYANRNADNFLIGRVLGAGQLGLYSFGYQAVLIPLQYIARPIAAVSFPSFSLLQEDPERCARGYLRTLEIVVLFCWSMAALGAFVAPPAIPLVFGAEWAPASDVVVILCGVAALHAFMNLGSTLLEGLGHPDVSFRWLAFSMLLNLTGFAVGIRWGIEGVAAGLLAASVVLLPIHWWVIGLYTRVRARSLVGLLGRGLLLWAAAALGWWLASTVVAPAAGLSELAIAAAITTGVVIVSSILVFRPAWVSIADVLRSPPR